MKRKLFLGLTLLSSLCFVSCSGSETPQNDDARLLIKAGQSLVQLSKDKTTTLTRGWSSASQDSLAFELKQPGIYFYLSGTVLNRANYDISKPVFFTGEFTIDMSPTQTIYMKLDIDMIAKLDRENGKMLFSGFQSSLQGPDKEHRQVYESPLFYEIGFDYDKEEVKDFKYYQTTTGSSTIIYFEYDKTTDEGKYYNVSEDDQTADGNRLRNEYLSRKNTFEEELKNKTIATGELNRQCCLSFVATQEYVDSIFGSASNMHYVEE